MTTVPIPPVPIPGPLAVGGKYAEDSTFGLQRYMRQVARRGRDEP